MPGNSESNESIPDESESEELNILKTNKSDEMHKRKGKDSNNDNLNDQNKIKRCKLNNEQIEMNSNVGVTGLKISHTFLMMIVILFISHLVI